MGISCLQILKCRRKKQIYVSRGKKMCIKGPFFLWRMSMSMSMIYLFCQFYIHSVFLGFSSLNVQPKTIDNIYSRQHIALESLVYGCGPLSGRINCAFLAKRTRCNIWNNCTQPWAKLWARPQSPSSPLGPRFGQTGRPAGVTFSIPRLVCHTNWKANFSGPKNLFNSSSTSSNVCQNNFFPQWNTHLFF